MVWQKPVTDDALTSSIQQNMQSWWKWCGGKCRLLCWAAQSEKRRRVLRAGRCNLQLRRSPYNADTKKPGSSCTPSKGICGTWRKGTANNKKHEPERWVSRIFNVSIAGTVTLCQNIIFRQWFIGVIRGQHTWRLWGESTLILLSASSHASTPHHLWMIKSCGWS